MTSIVVAVVGALMCAAFVAAARRADATARVRHLRPSARWRVPEPLRSSLARALVAADVDAGPEAAVEAWGIATLAVACVSGVVAPSMLVPALALCGFGAPFSLHVLRRRHERHFAVALPMALEQVAAELRGGGTVAGAVQRLGSAAGPVAHDLARVHARTRLGLGLVDALASWPREHDAPGVRAAAGALAVAAGLGGRAADAIDGLASSLRHRLDAAAEARALSTQARTSAIVVGAAPLGYLAFASVVDPSSVDALTTTGVGRVCLVVGVALEALAALWIRRIVTAEPS